MGATTIAAVAGAALTAGATVYASNQASNAADNAAATSQANTAASIAEQEKIRQENQRLLADAQAKGVDVYDKTLAELKQLIPGLNVTQTQLANETKNLYAPAQQLGLSAIPYMKEFITNPNMSKVWSQYAPALPSYQEFKNYASLDPTQDPNYQWQLKQGTKQLDARLAKLGLTNSGAGIQAYNDMVGALNSDAASKAYAKFKDLVSLEQSMENTAYGRKYGAITDAMNIGTNANNAIASTNNALGNTTNANNTALINALMNIGTGKANLYMGTATNATNVNTNAGNNTSAAYQNLGDNLGSITMAQGQIGANAIQNLGALPTQSLALYNTMTKPANTYVIPTAPTAINRTIDYGLSSGGGVIPTSGSGGSSGYWLNSGGVDNAKLGF